MIAQTHLADMLTVIERSLPTADSLQDCDNRSVVSCVTFISRFTCHYFTSAGCQLRLSPANSLMMQLFTLDVSYQLNVSTGGWLRSAWQHGLSVSHELCDTVNQMLTLVIRSVNDVADVGHISRLVDIVCSLWRVTATPSQSLDLHVMKDALVSSRFTLLRSSWFLAPVLDRLLFVYSLDGFELAASSDLGPHTRTTALAALTARFLLTSWKSDQPLDNDKTAAAAADDDDNDDDDDVNADKTNVTEEVTSLYIDMLLEVSLRVVYIEASQACFNQPSSPQQELKQNLCSLIGRLTDTEAECLIGRAMEQSMTNGEAWSLVFDMILRQLELCNKEVVKRSLSKFDVEWFVPLSLSSASTLCVLLSTLSHDIRQHVADVTVALLMSCDTDRITAFDSTYVTFNTNNNNTKIYNAHTVAH